MNENTNQKKTSIARNPQIPFVVAIIGSVIGIAASFIKYLTLSNGFLSRKTSVFQIILESLNNPRQMLAGTGDKIVFGLVVAGFVFSILSAVFVLTKKMKTAIIFTILALLPILMLNNMWIHWIGFGLTIVGAVWYMIAKKKTRFS